MLITQRFTRSMAQRLLLAVVAMGTIPMMGCNSNHTGDAGGASTGSSAAATQSNGSTGSTGPSSAARRTADQAKQDTTP